MSINNMPDDIQLWWFSTYFQQNQVRFWMLGCPDKKTLMNVIKRKTPYKQKIKRKLKEAVEHDFSRDPYLSFVYAAIFIKRPFLLGEPCLLDNIQYLYWYVECFPDYSRGWEEAENVFMKVPWYAYKYAYNILKGPFPKGEPIIATDSQFAYWYARNVIKGPWPMGENAIARNEYYRSEYEFVFKTDLIQRQ